ncbi:MAG: ABC transporter ATP-binding protein [Chloroflexi bacterium]|nr:ABC transporter ATP-binding protein [Chloroflexota bacterium]MYJ92477.1 ABC transporter ATP-binding protein [Chloroflexota bacterium]
MDVLLDVRELDKHFGGLRACDQATFQIETGAIAGMIGPNGAGKTTAFNCVAGFLKPDGGLVSFAGEDVTGFPPHRMFDRGLVRTFQIPQGLETMTVLENLMLAGEQQSGESPWRTLLLPGQVRREEERLEARAHEVLEQTQLAHQAYIRAGALSGGQRKLLELARALMAEPKMILLDEPSAGVNPALIRRLADHIRELSERLGLTFLIIEHNLDFIRQLCNPVVVMAQGRVLDVGAPDDVLANPEVQAAYLSGQRTARSA